MNYPCDKEYEDYGYSLDYDFGPRPILRSTYDSLYGQERKSQVPKWLFYFIVPIIGLGKLIDDFMTMLVRKVK